VKQDIFRGLLKFLLHIRKFWVLNLDPQATYPSILVDSLGSLKEWSFI
jgi:hypothetical protein